LVELLVVISIIAILLMIMAPTSRMLLMRTEMDICQSNLYHLGTANAQYWADWHTRFMPFRDWVDGNYNDLSLLTNPDRSLVYSYVNNAQFFLCPTFKTVCASNAVRSYVMQHSFCNTHKYWTSATTWEIRTDGWPGGSPWGNGYSLDKLSDVIDPARLMLLSEEATWKVQANGVWYSQFTVNDAHMCCSDWPNRDTIAQFHYPGPGPIDQQIEGKGNVVFVDGHVSPVVTTQTPYVVCQKWYNDPVKAADSGL